MVLREAGRDDVKSILAFVCWERKYILNLTAWTIGMIYGYVIGTGILQISRRG
ncbi:hypothetical protein K432DRAFT_469161, partial [Lepidopterella palustris CBS 459.81]